MAEPYDSFERIARTAVALFQATRPAADDLD